MVFLGFLYVNARSKSVFVFSDFKMARLLATDDEHALHGQKPQIIACTRTEQGKNPQIGDMCTWGKNHPK